MPIINKYNSRVKKVNSLACIGLDSEFSKLPKKFKSSKTPQFDFNKQIIDQTHEYVSSFKINIAFYEARGNQGIKELKKTMEYLEKKHPDIFTICDAKRGDIGNTNQGYVDSIFNWFGFDAVTLNPYLGGEALGPFLDRKDKGCVILCRTSNSGSGELQDLKLNGKPLWYRVAEKVKKSWNRNRNCLLVVGATYPKEIRGLRHLMGDMTFLVPGIGAQAGDIKSLVRAGVNSKRRGLIVHSARGVIFSNDPQKEVIKLKDEINRYR